MNSLHYSPPRNWINDPNGLVYHQGRYHLYFQYNPLGIEHANLSWGHASSRDLVTWDDHPVAIRFDEDEQIFSGSIVLDAENTTGLGSVDEPALIAFYTSDSTSAERQSQSIASSRDGGLNWTKYPGNPVLDRDSAHFRDPKIIRWVGEYESYWVMLAVEAMDRKVVLYRSDDLLSWTYLSSFGPAGAVGGVWECPDLFPLRVEGTGAEGAGETHWVLLVSLNPGGIAGGSGTQYFLGDFDGRTFTAHIDRPTIEPEDEAGMRALDWVDYGRDCYAGVTFAELPDEQRTLIAWMSNWDYAGRMAVDENAPQRGSMTLPRRLSLVEVDGETRLRQTPIAPHVAETARVEDLDLSSPRILPAILPDAGCLELSIALEDSAGFVITFEDAISVDEVGGPEDSKIVLSYDKAAEVLALDRRGSAVGHPAEFGSVERMPLAPAPVLTFTLWLDDRAVEIYAEDGTRVLTELIGSLSSPQMIISGIGPGARLISLVVSSAGGSAVSSAEESAADLVTASNEADT